VLLRLLPPETYDFWKQAGYLGTYCMSFMLRHTAAFLALAAHGRACPGAVPATALAQHFPLFDCAGAAEYAGLLADDQGAAGMYPVVCCSALGIHLLLRPAGTCRAFDFYADSLLCGEMAQGPFCGRHAAEAWWRADSPGASTQADMFRFYAVRQNLQAYNEQELADLVGRFWSRMKRFKADAGAEGPALEQALGCFGYAAVEDLRREGRLLLRRRYTELARQLHPDCGGAHESFVALKQQYDALSCLLEP
jgi:hypothetical protein